jgi:hypothetical protein
MPRWEVVQGKLTWNVEREQWVSSSTDMQPELHSSDALFDHYGDRGRDLVGVLAGE